MTCSRLLLSAVLLSPCVACQANTIELETMQGGSSAGDDTTGSGTDDPPATGSVSITVTDTVGPVDSGDSADESAGPVLDIGVDPGETQTLLLAIDTIVQPGLPFQGIVWLERGGTGTVNLTLQWLSLDQGSTTAPRELVGDVYTYPGIPVIDGLFTWETGVILVPGAANPITGSDVVLSAVADVVPQGSPYCGRVSGEVTSPIQVPLEGSTHAMTSVPSETELPLEFPMSCP